MIRTFIRKKIDPNRLYGSVVSESSDLILLHNEYDFEFDGYKVIRKKDITESVSSDSNDYCEKLMRKEGLWKNPEKWLKSLPIDGWKVLLSCMINKLVIVENERCGDFYLGEVVECGDHSVSIHYFDGCGKWTAIEKVQYRFITSVTFDSRYINIHGRHLQTRPNQRIHRTAYSRR